MEAAKHTHYLSVEIGPRPPTTESEARAAAYCASVLEAAGLETRLEQFKGLRSFGQIYIPTTAGLFLTAFMGTRKRARRLLGLGLGAVSMTAFLGEQTKQFRPISERVARARSQNVVGILRPKSDSATRRLVIVTHADSSRSGLAFHPKVARDFRRNSLVGVGAGFAAILAWLLPRKLRRLISLAASVIIGNCLFFLVHREIAGVDVTGANDNASGAGILLALAEALAADPPINTEIWFVVTGCEESDLIGMTAFIDAHEKDLQDAYFLGFDTCAGRGASVSWITESGMLEPLRADQLLVGIAKQTALERPELGGQAGVWRTAGLDPDVAAVRGLPVLNLMALTPEGTLPNWHWPTDTYENIDESLLENCYAFALEIVRRFDESGGPA